MNEKITLALMKFTFQQRQQKKDLEDLVYKSNNGCFMTGDINQVKGSQKVTWI